MATAKQLREAADLQAARDRAHAALLRDNIDDEATLIDILRDVVVVLRERAEHVRVDNRKGAKSLAASLSAAADDVAGLGALLANNPRPTSSGPNPHREPLPVDHRNEAFVSPPSVPDATGTDKSVIERVLSLPWADRDDAPQLDAVKSRKVEGLGWTTATLDDPGHRQVALPTLDAAFGEGWPNDAATREKLASLIDTQGTIGGTFDAAASGETLVTISGRIEPGSVEVKREPLMHITANGVHELYGLPREAITLCPAEAPALRTYRGGANCPDCIAVFDASPLGHFFVPINATADQSEAEAVAYNVGNKVTESPESWKSFDRIEQPTLIDPAPLQSVIHPARERMTPKQVRAEGIAQQRGIDHRSHSQLSSYEGCGTQYALRHLDRSISWWNVGGNAVHYAIEGINRVWHTYNTLPDDSNVQTVWLESFQRVVSEHELISGVPHEAWRAASRGAEAYDWWRVEGEAMVINWVEFLRGMGEAGWRIAAVDGTPVIEYAYTLPIHGAPVPDKGFIDVAFEREIKGEMWYRIVDIKAGKSTDHEQMQVGGQYRWGLWTALQGRVPIERITGAFWQARTGTLALATEWDYASMSARLASMDASERAGVYVPRPSWRCKTCGVADLCPVGPPQG